MDNSRATLNGSASSRGFPLPLDFFPSVDCSDAQGVVLQKEADKIVRDTVRAERWEMHYDDGVRGWKLASSKKDFRETGIRTYCCKPDTHTEKKSRRMDFKCMGKVTLPLDHAMDALYSDTTSDYRHNAGTLLGACLDAAVLHVIRARTEHYPHRYLGINWLALRSGGLFAKKRDVCYLRSMGKTFDADRNEIGYLVMRSIDVKACGSMAQSHGLVRTNISAILLLKESLDGRSTHVIWQGTLPLSGSSSSASKMVDLVHANFMSCVANLNVFTVTQYLSRGTDLERYVHAKRESKICRLCSKKFSLLRSRHHCDSCGEMMCRDCEITRKVTSLDRETMAMHPSFVEKENVRRYCKRCMVAAHKKVETAYAKPTLYDFTNSNVSLVDPTAGSPAVDPVEADAHHQRQSHDDRLSAISSSGSQCSLQLTWPDLSIPATKKKTGGPAYTSASTSSRLSYTGSMTSSPAFSKTTAFSAGSANLSTSQVPVSPLTIKTAKMNFNYGRDRLETDPWEYYDAFEQSKSQEYAEENEYEFEPEPDAAAGKHSMGGSGSGGRGSHTGSHSDGVDLATRLLEMSRIAQETLDVTRRNSCMMSDTGSAPRSSEHFRSSEQFHNLDKSIAEQADLLNVIGFVSTGRVYMETDEDENGESSGVRVSVSSIDESERFEEILT